VVAEVSGSRGAETTHAVHSPKIESFDIAEHVNVDNKGYARKVEKFDLQPFGLYMSRQVVGRLPAVWLESWLIPELGLRISKWTYTSGHVSGYDFHVDIVDIDASDPVWRVTDLYLDLEVSNCRSAKLVDIGEFVAAVGAGLLTPAVAESALQSCYRIVAGLAEYEYSLDRWAQSCNLSISWRNTFE
jgi:uncharacterized protein